MARRPRRIDGALAQSFFAVRAALLLRALALVAALLVAAPALAQPRAQPVRVFAAASLTDALNELGRAYAATGQPAPVFNFAASSALARQIEQGADADIFISADEPWMDHLAERNLIAPQTRVSFLSNRLVLIAPNDRRFSLRIARGMNLHRALRGGRLAMADPDSVPAGRYGRAALEYYGAWAGVQSDVVRAENVRAALRFVELGEAAAGIVYLSDARATQRVSVVATFPEASHPRISYPMAVIAENDSPRARAFAAFLQSGRADAVFRRAGFIVP